MPSVVMSRTVLTKSSPAGTARAKAHYIAREGSYGPAARKVAYVDRTETYAVRDDLVHAETRNLPAWAPDAATFFSVAEAQERARGVVLTEYKFSLPRGLDRAQQLRFTRDFVQLHLPTNPVSWALHEPPGLGGTPSPHVHMIWSARELDGIERSPTQFFRRYNAAHPERGGARKSPALNQWNAPAREKQLFADLANVHLVHAGVDLRYHPGTLASRGLQLTPEPKLLPSDSHAYHSRGTVTKGMQTLLDHRAKMAPHRAEEAVDAHQYWDSRTQQLGLTPDMPHAQALTQIAAGRAAALRHPPPKVTPAQRTAELQRLAETLAPLQAHVQALDSEVAILGARQRLGRSMPPEKAAQIDALLERGEALDRQRDLTRVWSRPLIGNSKSMIYHTPEHLNYGDVHPSNQVHFSTEQAAIEAGYRRAANEHYGVGSGVPMTLEDTHRARAAALRAEVRQRQRAGPGVSLAEDEGEFHGVKASVVERDSMSY